jgi:hypothetical protein
MPVFRGLFPKADHDALIQELLYACCEWDSLAKLRFHADATLLMLEDSTKALGRLLRQFADGLCPNYHTLETERETAGRQRREHRQASERARRGNTAVSGTQGIWPTQVIGPVCNDILNSGPS